MAPASKNKKNKKKNLVLMDTPSSRFEKSLTKDNLWIYIFTLLKQRDLYPYEIKDAIKTEFGFEPGNMTAYIVLKKLQAGGYVTVVKKEQVKGPERTFYKITDKGITELDLAKELHKKIGAFLFDSD